MKSLAPYQSNCSLAQRHLFCSCPPSRDLKAVYVEILCWNGRMQKQNRTTQLQYFQLCLYTAFLDSESFPSNANIRTNLHVFGPCCYISVRFFNRGPLLLVYSSSACVHVVVLRAALPVPGLGEVMKPVGEGFRAWSNPLLVLASLMGGMNQVVQTAVPAVSEGEGHLAAANSGQGHWATVARSLQRCMFPYSRKCSTGFG